ncbi:helix-turn-helix domain-containing protein [Neisseria meningitidis]|uniref:helix-turn-helix domain-containing protein n=1 Tax=Neisseria meningitidis TaxID=487 RepID=UPI001EDF4CC7|nr:helix-turn-helix transcriptional regulator [Neisseria meningitidis]
MMGNKLTLPAELPDEQDLRAVLAYNMRLFRVNKGWSQEELARQCGLDRTYVSAVERKRWNIALSNIEKMAAALGVAAYQLLLPPQERLKLRPLQNSFPSRQPKPKHRFSAVFAPNTS